MNEGGKLLRLASAVFTVLGLVAQIGSGIIAQKQLDEKVIEQVTKALEEHRN